MAEPNNAKFAREDQTAVDCDIIHNGEVIRYTASPADTEPAGRALYAILMLDQSKIAPYEEPKKIDLNSKEA